MDFSSTISSNQLWFAQKGNDLQIDLLGTSQHISIAGWFAGNVRAQVQSFNTSDGMKLDDQVSQLVQAMATYAANNPGFDPAAVASMPTDPSLQNALATSWHH